MALNKSKTYNIGRLKRLASLEAYTLASYQFTSGTDYAPEISFEAIETFDNALFVITFTKSDIGFIRAISLSGDGMGGSFPTWVKVKDVWCDIMPLSGRELLEFGAVASNVSHRIIMRYRSNLTTDNRIVWDSRQFNIKSALNLDEEQKIIELLAMEEQQSA